VAYFVVFGEYGPAKLPGVRLEDQPDWKEHAEFMDRLAEEGLILLAGPVGRGGESVVLVAEAGSVEAVEERLSADPWRDTGVLQKPRIEPWEVRIGDLSLLMA
jgi:uncharacterized protein YciI